MALTPNQLAEAHEYHEELDPRPHHRELPCQFESLSRERTGFFHRKVTYYREEPYMDIQWSTVAAEFEFDGSWRDVYIEKTDFSDWQAVLDALRQSPFKLTYMRAGSTVSLPESAEQAFPQEGFCDRLLTVSAAEIDFRCHFFDKTQIEFDIDPRQVTSQAKLDAVFAFMRLISSATSKSAVLTPENLPERAVFAVRHDTASVEYFPCNFDNG